MVRNKIVNNHRNGVTAIMTYVAHSPFLNHTGHKELANDIYANGDYDVYYEEQTGIGAFYAAYNYWGPLLPVPSLYGYVYYVPWVDSTHTLVCYTKDDCDPGIAPTTWGTIKTLYR
jgi:hypothetical protein